MISLYSKHFPRYLRRSQKYASGRRESRSPRFDNDSRAVERKVRRLERKYIQNKTSESQIGVQIDKAKEQLNFFRDRQRMRRSTCIHRRTLPRLRDYGVTLTRRYVGSRSPQTLTLPVILKSFDVSLKTRFKTRLRRFATKLRRHRNRRFSNIRHPYHHCYIRHRATWTTVYICMYFFWKLNEASVLTDAFRGELPMRESGSAPINKLKLIPTKANAFGLHRVANSVR